jgi:hypothetical protein
MIPETNFCRIKPPDFHPNATGKTEVSNCTITTTYRGGRTNISNPQNGSILFYPISPDFFERTRFSEVNRAKKNFRGSGVKDAEILGSDAHFRIRNGTASVLASRVFAFFRGGMRDYRALPPQRRANEGDWPLRMGDEWGSIGVAKAWKDFSAQL